MEKLKLKVIDYLTKHPKPKDEKEFHKFAETISNEHGVAEETAYEILGDLLAGGKSKGKILKVDPKELAMGIEVELEHTKDRRIAEKIARDHLVEISDYYTRLKKMEASAEKPMKKAYIRIFDNLYVYMGKAVPKSTYQHSNKLGAGAKKRKGLKNPQDKVEAVMHEFKTGKLHSGSRKIVTDRDQAIAIAMSESGQSKKMKIEEKESGHKSVPKEYKGVKNFADMINKKYPLDNEKHVRAAISYFAMPRNHSEYKPEERKTIAGKIQSAAKKYGINISENWLKKFDLMEKARNIKYIKRIPKPGGGYKYIYSKKENIEIKKTSDEEDKKNNVLESLQDIPKEKIIEISKIKNINDFKEKIKGGKLIQATHAELTELEKKAQTPIEVGMLNNYNVNDIAFFYAKSRGFQEEGTDQEKALEYAYELFEMNLKHFLKKISNDKMQKAILIKYNELYKAKAEAVGTVHTYKSGLKYKKTADGKWIQISEGKKDTQGTKLDDKEKTFDKQENPQKSKNKELLKNTIKKIADIVAQALKGGETNPAAGRAVEQLGENIKREPKEKSKKVKE